MTGATVVFWRGRRTLVTGATGLIGSHLVGALLGAGAEVTVLLRDQDRRSGLTGGECVLARRGHDIPLLPTN